MGPAVPNSPWINPVFGARRNGCEIANLMDQGDELDGE